MHDFKAPYVSQRLSKDAVPFWTFKRKGHLARLPEGMVEPWYSPEYVDALRASGLREIQVLRVLESLPRSLASAVATYKPTECITGAYGIGLYGMDTDFQHNN